jgi:dTDP-4-dehydrorhamnose 3,5-epimerase
VVFTETAVKGVFRIEAEKRQDERGFFARTWCQKEFAEHGLSTRLVQSSVSFSRKKGTLRGLHYQDAPHREVKLVRCTKGSIYDVAVDLRPDSTSFLRHTAVVLSAENRSMLYIPEGCAHGFQTLEPGSEVEYQMSEFYCPECARGVRWDDPIFAIEWPPDVRTMAERDRRYPDFRTPNRPPAEWRSDQTYA